MFLHFEIITNNTNLRYIFAVITCRQNCDVTMQLHGLVAPGSPVCSHPNKERDLAVHYADGMVYLKHRNSVIFMGT
jgi:hypothetical protein